VDAHRQRLARQIVARRLLQDDMFTGWGCARCRARAAVQPMSYHNGSVWPHDTALAAVGMRHYGMTSQFLTLATGLFESVLQFDDMRMPELFCGFPRVAGYAPTRYPVACSPQAWATGVVFQLVGAMLGLRPEAADNQITLSRPTLPGWLTWLEVRGLRVSKSRLGVRVSQAPTAPPWSCSRATATPSSSSVGSSAAEIQEEAADERDDERGADRGVFALAGRAKRSARRGARRPA